MSENRATILVPIEYLTDKEKIYLFNQNEPLNDMEKEYYLTCYSNTLTDLEKEQLGIC